MRSLSTRAVLAVLLLVALLLAGVASHYASDRPDGLERVATDQGFADSAEERLAGAPMSDYQATGIGDSRLSGAAAGVTGTLLVLALAGGLTYVVRRRTPETADRG